MTAALSKRFALPKGVQRLIVLVLGVVLVTASACGGEHRPAREIYNRGVAALAQGDHEVAEKLLLEARSQAGVDPELRFRAAYDLGLAYAAHAEKVKQGEGGKPGDLAKALELAQQALSWLGDAARLRTDDPSTQTNLAIVRARIQAISDELRKAEGSLEARLDRLIEDQRAVLDDARRAWISIRQAGGTDPLAQQGTLTRLADRERGIVAEAGVIGDLAADEIDGIAKKPDDQRQDEEKVRLVQLQNLDLYVTDARTRIADARRKLQELAAEDGVTKAEAALVSLKRAREQLLDPITVLRGVAQDEVVLLQETTYAATASGALTPLGATQPPPPAEIPAWMTAARLAERQGGLRDRVEEVRARLVEASLAAPAPGDVSASAPAAEGTDPAQARLIERVRAALPAITEASAAMARARDALASVQGAGAPKAAIDHERAALAELAKAIEQFADLKQTIELAHADQGQLVALLSPASPSSERAKEARDALARNVARMPRLKQLIADEVAQLDAQEKQLAAQPTPPAPDPGAGSGSAQDPATAPQQAAQQELAQRRQLYTRAEELRGQAEAALAQLEKAIAANQDPLAPAKDAQVQITELRKLFFSVIEHLQQLIRDQGETRDQTSTAHGLDALSRDPKLPGLIDRQTGHGELAKAIIDALAAQADQAAQTPPQPGAPDGKALAAAAGEVRLAHDAMNDANRTLTKARDATATSESIAPALDQQREAIEHLEAALRHLQPPKDEQQQQQEQQEQDQQQEQPQDQQQQQQQPSAGGASQRVRDEDARRQRERRQPQRGPDPVEKDW